MEILIILITVVSVIISIASLVFWIMTVIKAFQNDGALLGILSICPLVGFIIGWVKHKEWDHAKIMTYWTICIIASVVLNFISIGIGAAVGASGP